MMTLRARGVRRLLALAALVAAAGAAGCSETSVGGFTQPAQVQILSGNTTVATATRSNVTGSIVLVNGVNTNFSVRLLDDDGNPIAPALPESIDAAVGNEVLVTYTRGTQGNNFLPFSLRGNSAGNTTIRILVFSGFSLIYESAAIPIVVG